MKLAIIGGHEQHETIDVNPQQCINMWPTTAGKGGRGDGVLVPTAGVVEIADFGPQSLRQIAVSGDSIFVVCNNSVYKLFLNTTTNIVETQTVLGTISTTSGTVSIADSGKQLLFVDGSSTGYVYSYQNRASVILGPIGGTAADTYTLTLNGSAIYTAQDVSTALTGAALATHINLSTGSTGITASFASPVLTLSSSTDTTITVAESGTGFTAGTDGITVTGGPLSTGSSAAFRSIPDTDFQGGSQTTFIDGYFFYAKPSSAFFYVSALDDALTWDALDVASATTAPDNIIAINKLKGDLWIFGNQSTEVWYDAANPTGMPFSFRAGFSLTNGCAAPDSVIQLNDKLIWLDSRGLIVTTQNSSMVRSSSSTYDAGIISSPEMATEISTYKRWDDAIACSYIDRAHSMYQITFPTDNVTWVFDEQTQEWHKRTYINPIDNTEIIHLLQFSQIYKNRTVGGGYRNGKLYLQDISYKTDDGQPIRRKRVTSVFNDEFKKIEISCLELRMLSGVAPSDGQGSDPMIMIRYSNDGGHTWSNEIWRSFGRVGEYGKHITINRLGTGMEWIFEFVITEPINFSIFDASVNIVEEEL